MQPINRHAPIKDQNLHKKTLRSCFFGRKVTKQTDTPHKLSPHLQAVLDNELQTPDPKKQQSQPVLSADGKWIRENE